MSDLDNPVWSALTTRQRDLGRVGRLSARFDPALSPFAAFSAVPTPEHWADLADLIGPSGQVALVHGSHGAEEFNPPPGWTGGWRGRAYQMVAPDKIPDAGRTARASADRVVALGPDDVADMLSLVEVARPGPFLDRTVEFGGYVGIRRDGLLVAMAGERLRPPGHVEISAVATHPDHRRKGLAELLVDTVARSVTARGELPILHVSDTNSSAISLYEAMGFSVRTTIVFQLLGAPPAG